LKLSDLSSLGSICALLDLCCRTESALDKELQYRVHRVAHEFQQEVRHNSSEIGLPWDMAALKPRMPPIVGTKSVQPRGRSWITPSRTPAPRAIIQVVRERASPVR